jgi:hypothetical protein
MVYRTELLADMLNSGNLPESISSWEAMAMRTSRMPGVSQQEFDQKLKESGYTFDTVTMSWIYTGQTAEDVTLPPLTAEGSTTGGGFSYQMPNLGSSWLTEYLKYQLGGGGGSPSGRTDNASWYSNVGGTVWNTGR